MAVSAKVRINASYPAVIFAETSSGYFGTRVESKTSTTVTSTDSRLRVVAVPTERNRYISRWTNAGSGVVTDYGLVTFTSTNSLAAYPQTSTTSAGPSVTVEDAHGKHYGSPTGTSYHVNGGGIVAVQHASADSGYEFAGWTVAWSSSSGQGTILSAGGTTSGQTTTFPASYTDAVVLQVGTSSTYSVTVTAVYTEAPTPPTPTTYTIRFERNADGVTGSDIPSTTCSSDSYVTLPNPTGWSYPGYVFYKWNTQYDGSGTAYAAGENFTPSQSTYPSQFVDTVFLYATWTPSHGAGAKQDFDNTSEYPNVTINRDLYYRILISSNLPSSCIITYETRSIGWGAFLYNGTRYSTETQQLIGVELQNPVYTDATPEVSPTYNTFGVYADSASDIPNNTSLLYPYDPSSYTENSWKVYIHYYSKKLATFNYDNQIILETFNPTVGTWKWIAPNIQNFDFVGWFTSASITSSVPALKSSYTLLISANQTITWNDILDGLNYYQATTQANVGKYYNFLRLVYRGVKVLVLFNANGGILTSQYYKNVYYNEQYGTLPTPTWGTSVFQGWYTAASGGTLVEATTIVQNTTTHTLYAHWSGGSIIPTTVTVSFDAMGGSSSFSSRTVTVGSTYGTLPSITPPSGMTSAGWFLLPTGGTQITSSTTVTITADHTLYAHYNAVTYTITFNGNGGSPATQTESYLANQPYNYLPMPTYAGHSFEGWYTASTGGTKVSFSDIVTSSRTLYARWSTQEQADLYTFIIT